MDRRRDMTAVVLLAVFSCVFSELFAQKEPVCNQGFFMSEQHTCLPCNCKGHAQDCEDITGICIDCQDHSTGDFCERCEDGYILQVSHDGQHECRPCACPVATETNNFATHCDVRGVALRCVCQDGYVGHYCERCAPGYYGNPTRAGDSCKKCDCNGNSDPNLIFNECHNVTGKCLHCYHNTAGNNCERCAHGYYGDAISAKDCRKCECNQCGTASCDDRTGVCHCKPGVTGRLCDSCEDGHSGFRSCMGCRRCECASAALHPSCNTLTQACQCRLGAGGRYCENCLPGYWDYTHTGCKKCDCPEGNCDVHTGECLPEKSQVSECSIDCDECIWHLIGDVRQSNKTLDQIRNSVLNISTGAAAYDRLKYYNYTAHTLSVQFVGWRNKSAVLRRHTGELEEETVHLQTDTELLTHQEDEVVSVGKQVDIDTLHSFTVAEMLAANLTSLNVLIEDMISDWEVYRVQQDVGPEQQKQKESEAEHMLNHMRMTNLTPKQSLATQENTHTHQLLQHVRQMEKSVLLMEGRLPAVRQLMKHFSSSLTHGQIYLHKAHDTLQQTHNTHTHNLLHLQRREAHKNHLMESYNAVNQTVMSANDILIKAAVGVADLATMVKNVTEYHAEVDGAAVLIQERTDQLSKADHNLVQRATEHAQELQRHAHELQHNLKGSDTHGFVQKALEASNVYDNIVKYINEADEISVRTKNMSIRTEDALDGLNSQLNFLKTQSSDVFKESVTRNSEYTEVDMNVADTKKYIEETRDMLQTSQVTLEELIKNMNTLQRVQKLQSTQEAAERALNHTAEVLGVVTPIREQVEEWSRNMRNNQYSTSSYEQAVDSAHTTVEDLSAIVPQLLTKLHDVEERKPFNVSTNIMRVRELIAQARSVASKVQVSMKFNGQSSVELHPPADVDELKVVTSISLYVRVDPDTDPIEDRFLLYLGDKNGHKDYMGVAIKNDNLVFVYNLGGDVVEIPLGSKPVSSWPPVFNHVRVERLGRHGKVYLTVPSQEAVAEQKFIQKGEWDGTESLYHLDPRDTVFIIGGAPPDVKLPPALSLAPFVGCIELISLNNDVISLYNFKKLHKMDMEVSRPCPRYKLAFSQGRVASYLFDGSGYALVRDIERRGRISVVTRFDIEVRTVAHNGVLLLMVNESKFFVLEMRNGFLRLVYDFGFTNGPIVLEGNLTKLQINDARYHEVSVIYHQSKKVILLVDRSFVKSTDNEKKTLPFNDIYIGGVPSDVLHSRSEFSSLIGLKGCVKGFQFQKKDFNLLEEPGTIGISSGCPEESFMSLKAYFTGDGYLSSTARISPLSSFEGGLSFRTTEPSGLLFYHRDGTDEFSLSLENGAVVLHSRGTKVKSRKHYSDGRPHFLVASVTKHKYQLVVDDRDKQDKKNPGSVPHTDGVKEFYYGGSAHSNINNFTGCIGYAYISRQDRDIEAEDFQRYTKNVGVSLQDCPLQNPPTSQRRTRSAPHIPNNTHSTPYTPAALQQSIMGVQDGLQVAVEKEATSCYHSPLPYAVRNAHYFSDNSQLVYDGIAEVIRERSEFSVSVRTRSVQGMIVSVCGEADFMALFLFNGKLFFTFGFMQYVLQLHSTHTLNDGSWHEVVFNRHGDRGVLFVDGVLVMEDKVPSDNVTLKLQDPLHVGSPPEGCAMNSRKVRSGFSGCVRDLRLNGHFLSSVPRNFGVTPCFDGSSEAGVFFFEEGGHAVLSHSLSMVGLLDVVMELRPRVASALLLHSYITPGVSLCIYLQQGQVFVHVNNETHTVNFPSQDSLCDGNWHRVKVVGDHNGLMLDVDGKQKHVISSRFPVTKHSAFLPVYIGGTPEAITLPVSVKVKSSYIGCMRNLSFNQQSVNFRHSLLIKGAVSVDGCPVA
ncbi:laminin subunit alpha-4 isoform X2 [Tachysurus fulvidraco]|uniref:laminin subunit alpha-4 isoform X2 n=1 Tax=Tachysurus fulvidraco TaxID=1234273 RepID=UPI001FF01635|nr:laminin subunit alpha-4 isoform X2 [Tachysurus fulvidraco]